MASNNQKNVWRIRRKGKRFQKFLPRKYVNIFISHSWDRHENEYLWLLKELQSSTGYYFYDRSISRDLRIRASEKQIKNVIRNRMKSVAIFFVVFEEGMELTEWMKMEIEIASKLSFSKVVIVSECSSNETIMLPLESNLVIDINTDDPCKKLFELFNRC